MNGTATVLIAGAGYVGTELGLRLCAEGYRVLALRRNPRALPSGLTPVAADLLEPESLRSLPALDLLFYTAAPDESSDAGYEAAYVRGLANILDAVQARRVLFTSSTAVYAQDDGSWVDESSPTEPDAFSGKRLLQAEALLLARHPDAVVLRLAGIYGPGRDRLLRSVRDGTAHYPESGPGYTNRIHRDDCAGALHHLARLESPERVYVGVDDEPAPRRAVLTWLAEQLDAPPPQPTSRAASRGTSKRCSNRRLKSTGYRFAYPSFREGYRAMIAAR